MRTMPRPALLVTGIATVLLSGGCVGRSIPGDTLRKVRIAAARELPQEARVEVRGKVSYFSKPAVVVSAHLLEGTSADDNNPFVRGDYGSHEKLTHFVTLRCARVCAAIFKAGIDLTDASEVIICARHGVRTHYNSWSGPSSDIATTIFEVSLSVEKAKEISFETPSTLTIERVWRVRRNTIPHLQISTYP